ncbi:hypothetical protein RQP53_22055 [Paucibacter sp. APW11]|uniref:Uncharacterized protein n=1 Tax=Roseateles aquae TaxID=3077235 RepID=A0ABU3PHY9_9BURK|nr:hypothetical protein [Paucibacter sp. APW11]MDT9001977.1 hypothetical protein [Paucibacter sp. APW11]
MHRKLTLQSLSRVFASLDAVRNGPALYALLATFCFAGLLLAMAEAEADLARADQLWGGIWGVCSVLVAFYGVNTTGLILMDQAQGRPLRDVQDAFFDALRCAHRGALSVLALLLMAALLLALLLGLLWAVRLPRIGTALFALLVPLGVLMLGGMALAGAVLVGPLTGPSIWAGQTTRTTIRMMLSHMRYRLLDVAALMGTVLALTAVMSAAVSLVLMAGGRAMALLSIWVAGVDVPPQQLMAGLFGYGLRSLGASGLPATASATGQLTAALIGGGAVFALALVLPTLLYLRGCCAVYLALQDTPVEDATL